MTKDWVAILDFGSQYTHLIARRVRELKVYSEIVPYNISAAELGTRRPTAIILSGGPASVTSSKSPSCDKRIFELDIPVLGICYGAQLMSKLLGGRVAKSAAREYGPATLRIEKGARHLFPKGKKRCLAPFSGLKPNEPVWMSHGDRIMKLPKGFKVIGTSPNSPVAAMANRAKRLYGVQFHPEVAHTPKGKKILRNFVCGIAGARASWSMKSFIDETVKSVRRQAKGERILCALSGGVDSSVMAALLHKAIGKKLIAIFIDNGVLRKDERRIVEERFRKRMKLNLKVVDARKEFLDALCGVTDPEKKRKIIGKTFIRVFEKEAKKLGKMKFLAQGTLYPDVIESRSPIGGPSATIKTHHNVGGLPKRMKFELIEPLKDLFKDEVRELGRKLGMSDELVNRHPFPGPGLAVRIVGAITKERLDVLREADWILINEIKRAGVYNKLWQVFCVLLPVKTVGVMGDERTYENVVAVRAVTSEDAMTAHWAKLPPALLERISNHIINEVKGVNRVVYDISSKPPSTIEWE